MVKKISAYQAIDGSVFTEKSEAKIHDAKLQVSDFVKFGLPFGAGYLADTEVSGADKMEAIEKAIAALILDDATELTKMLAPLVKAAKGGGDDEDEEGAEGADAGGGEVAAETAEAAPEPTRRGGRRRTEAPASEPAAAE